MKMKTLVVMMAIVALATAAHSQDTSLNELKGMYEKAKATIDAKYDTQESKALSVYGQALDGSLKYLKQQGKLDAYLELQKEKKRYDIEKSVPPLEARENPYVVRAVKYYDDLIVRATSDKSKSMDFLNRQYVTRLKALIAQLMREDKIAEAQMAKLELEQYGTTAVASNNTQTPASSVRSGPRKPIPYGARPFNGHHYKVFKAKKPITWGSSKKISASKADSITWHKAKEECERLGGHLVTITSKEELDFVNSLLVDDANWIGLYKTGKGWVWVTEEPVSFKNWGPKRPDGIDGKKRPGVDYAGMSKSLNGQWNDHISNNSHFTSYVCEWDY